uniref:Uncharacterized protein n=1 Tax=Astatotilapia calliptera TaxID=8154 RepID=A0AAX7UX74_ASTCA
MVLTGVIQNLFDYIRVVKLFKDGNLLIDSLQRPFRLGRPLGKIWPLLTWETCLPHQPLLGKHLHRLQHREGNLVGLQQVKRNRKSPAAKKAKEKINSSMLTGFLHLHPKPRNSVA